MSLRDVHTSKITIEKPIFFFGAGELGKSVAKALKVDGCDSVLYATAK